MKICIGIISYLPDDRNIKEVRFNKLIQLIIKCNQLFALPIKIITQNYTSFDRDRLERYNHVELSDNFSRLGIVGARKKLREWFITTDYDYMIMIDDDIKLSGNSGINYLNQIKSNPNCFIEFNKSRLQLFAISKNIFKQVNFLDEQPELGQIFEDRAFVSILEELFPDKKRQFKETGLYEQGDATSDINSTWKDKKIDLDFNQMINNTKKVVKDYIDRNIIMLN